MRGSQRNRCAVARQASDAIERVREFTKSSTERLEAMAWSLRIVDAEHVPGDVVEVGVWRCGNIMLSRLLSPSRICWAYDTFNGMTEPDPDLDVKAHGLPMRALDKYHSKKAAGRQWNAWPLREVMRDFHNSGITTDRMHFVEGPVEQTLQMAVPDHIAVLRLDVDWHLPTKASLEALYPLVVNGGFLIVDDYGHWAGCRKAVDDYFGVDVPPHMDVDYTCRIFRKC